MSRFHSKLGQPAWNWIRVDTYDALQADLAASRDELDHFKAELRSASEGRLSAQVELEASRAREAELVEVMRRIPLGDLPVDWQDEIRALLAAPPREKP